MSHKRERSVLIGEKLTVPQKHSPTGEYLDAPGPLTPFAKSLEDALFEDGCRLERREFIGYGSLASSKEVYFIRMYDTQISSTSLKYSRFLDITDKNNNPSPEIGAENVTFVDGLPYMSEAVFLEKMKDPHIGIERVSLSEYFLGWGGFDFVFERSEDNFKLDIDPPRFGKKTRTRRADIPTLLKKLKKEYGLQILVDDLKTYNVKGELSPEETVKAILTVVRHYRSLDDKE